MTTAVEALAERAVPTPSGDLAVCPTCEVVLIDAEQTECSRCADMPRLVREIRSFKQPGGREL